MVKAKDLAEGQMVIAEDGSKLRIDEVGRFPGIRLGLKGHRDGPGIMLSHRLGWTLLHPEAEVETA